jgi:hypothetical protein
VVAENRPHPEGSLKAGELAGPSLRRNGFGDEPMVGSVIPEQHHEIGPKRILWSTTRPNRFGRGIFLHGECGGGRDGGRGIPALRLRMMVALTPRARACSATTKRNSG